MVPDDIKASLSNDQYRLYKKLYNKNGKSYQTNCRMLDSEGASAVGITLVPGHLTDHYNPRDNSLHLSEENHSGSSVASVAVACHEAGHAIQIAKGYLPYRLRSALIPIVNFAQQTWVIVLVIGVALRLAGLTQLAIALFAFSVLFQLVTQR